MALMHVNFFSNTLGMCVSMDVILPQKTQGQIGMSGASRGGPYSTLYLLHGMSDDHTIWQRRTSIERYADAYDLAVVMPSTALGWYTDTAYGQKWYTYIAEELPAICRQFFHLSDKAEKTFVAGLSMGGYGAAKLALSAPETFSHAATLSGAVNIIEACREPAWGVRDKTYWEGIFGTADQNADEENDLFVLAEARKKDGRMPRFFQWCGTEDFLCEGNRKFRDHLKSLGYDLTYSEGPGGHEWRCWDEQIQRVLDWLPVVKNAQV